MAGTHDDFDRLPVVARMLAADILLAKLGDQILAQRVPQQAVLEADVDFTLGKCRRRASRAGHEPRTKREPVWRPFAYRIRLGYPFHGLV